MLHNHTGTQLYGFLSNSYINLIVALAINTQQHLIHQFTMYVYVCVYIYIYIYIHIRHIYIYI